MKKTRLLVTLGEEEREAIKEVMEAVGLESQAGAVRWALRKAAGKKEEKQGVKKQEKVGVAEAGGGKVGGAVETGEGGWEKLTMSERMRRMRG
jgi:hypothetical protein